VGLAGLAAIAITLPDPSQVEIHTGEVKILDRNQKVIEDITGDQVRQEVGLDKISPNLQAATVSAEDRHFFTHHGIDWGRLAKALTVDVVLRRPEQGASTITQQLAKLELLGGDRGLAGRTVIRKVREAILASELEQRFSKEDILRLYLNAIYYGHHAYGAQAAAKVYFDKNAKDLDLAQASFLAGLPQAPSYYDPQVNYEAAKAKQKYVLDQMVRDSGEGLLDAVQGGHKVTRAEADAAFAEDLRPQLKYKVEAATGPAPHFAQYVVQELDRIYGKEQVHNGSGLTVTTTMDLDIQNAANDAVHNGLPKLTRYGVNNAALLALDQEPGHVGEILALVGSYDFNNDSIAGQLDIVERPRQPGSSFKPYDYVTGIANHKFNTLTTFHDTADEAKSLTGKADGVRDFDNGYQGNMTLRTALVESRNIPAEEAMRLAGPDEVIATAHRYGIISPLQSNLATAIGASEVSMLEHAEAYGVFATQGTKRDPVAILKVINSDGTDITQRPGGEQRVADSAPLFIVNDVLKGYNGRWNLGFDRPMAAKSGTSNVGTSTGDGWMMAYNPHLVIAAWAGHTTNDPAKESAATKGFYGVYTGQQITAPFLRSAFKDRSRWDVPFTKPDGVVQSSCQNPEGKDEGAPAGGDYLLQGDASATCPTPSPTESPSPTAAPTPSLPVPPPPCNNGILGPDCSSPQPSPRPSPSPRPGGSPNVSPPPRPGPSP
jgi:membrane peptidoglycan carboxypeptidase